MGPGAAPSVPAPTGRTPLLPYLTAAAIVLHWTIQVYVCGLGEAATPQSVRGLALGAAVKTGVVVAVVVGLLHLGGERLADLGFSRMALRLALRRGLVLAIALFLVFEVEVAGVGVPPLTAPTSSKLASLFRDPREAPFWVFAAVVGGGFTEELERAFVLTRFERWFGTAGLVLAVLTESAGFGASHTYQGTGAAVSIGIFGLLLSLVFLRRRLVADAMIAHAGFDLIGIALAYAQVAGARAPG